MAEELEQSVEAQGEPEVHAEVAATPAAEVTPVVEAPVAEQAVTPVESKNLVEVAAGAPVAEPVKNENFRWYILHAYSGFERKVKESIMSRVQAFGLESKIGDVVASWSLIESHCRSVKVGSCL